MGECKKVTIYRKLLTKNRNELLIVCKDGNSTSAERIIITNPGLLEFIFTDGVITLS